MPTELPTTTVVRVNCQVMECGRFFISSPDLKGLYLVDTDLERLTKKIAPAIKQLYRLNHGYEVEVMEAADPNFQKPATHTLIDHLQALVLVFLAYLTPRPAVA